MNALSSLAAAFRAHPQETLPEYLPPVLHQPEQLLDLHQLIQMSAPYVLCFAVGVLLFFFFSERSRELKQINQETKKENS